MRKQYDFSKGVRNKYAKRLDKCPTDMVLEFFEGDRDKAWLWWRTPNPMFAQFTPQQMISIGRIEKVEKFIRTAMDENKCPSNLSGKATRSKRRDVGSSPTKGKPL